MRLREADNPLRRECKRILSLSALAGRKVELVCSTVTLVVKRMGMGALASASRVSTGNKIDLRALDTAVEEWADFRPMVGAEVIVLGYMLLSLEAIEGMVDPLPHPYEVTREAVNSLQQRLTSALLRIGHLVGEEARNQAVSYTDALAQHVVSSLTISKPMPLLLQDCHVTLENHPVVVLDMAVMSELELKVSYLHVLIFFIKLA